MMEQFERRPFTDRFESLRREADSWKPAWRDIQTYIAPTRGSFDIQQPNQGKKINHKKVVNGHASNSLKTLASGLTSGLTSPSRPWFRLGLADTDLLDFEPVKFWVSRVQSGMMAVFSKSNIYGALNTVYQEIGAFGTAACSILPDFKDVIRARVFTIGEYFLGNGPDNRVCAFAREFYMTLSNVIREFGEDNVSEHLRTTYKNNTGNSVDQWVKINHLVEYNDMRITQGRKRFGDQHYRSMYWEASSPTDTFLKVSGFEEFPILAPRWDTTTSADIYGRSPGWQALGDVKMLQKMEIDKLKALDKVVDPPMQADASVEEVNTLPGGLTRSSLTVPNAGARPLFQIAPDFNMIENSIAKTEARIDRVFDADLFTMILQADRPNMTAREIAERHEEKLLMLGPVLERLESELLDPLIDRTFNIMLRAGMIPPPPQELQGQELKVEYISMLAQAQKMVGLTSIEQLFRFGGSLIPIYPQVADKMNPEEGLDQYAEMLGTPPKLVRAKEEVAMLQNQKANEAKKAQMQAALPSMVGGAKTLSDTKLGQNSALDLLLAGMNNGEPATVPGAAAPAA